MFSWAELEEEVFVSILGNVESEFVTADPQGAVDLLLGLTKVSVDTNLI